MTDAKTHDARIVEQFTRLARPFAEHPIHSEADGMARTIAACGSLEGARVLDVACGPGIVACALAAHAAQVSGIDLTPAMIAQAERRQAGLGLRNVDWRVGDASALPFAGRDFRRGRHARYSFHHLQRAGGGARGDEAGMPARAGGSS